VPETAVTKSSRFSRPERGTGPGVEAGRCYDAKEIPDHSGGTEHVEITERPTTTLLTLTESAATKIKQLLAEDEDVSVLRVAIQGGGCSGFQYGLGFDRGSQEGDYEFEAHGVTVVIDPFSAPYLQGAEVDYVDTIQAAGFAINNPNAVSSCGCGHSFQVADEEAAGDDAHAGGCGSGCSH
jgi:iron-sulfur cluster assembly accessory protein